MKDFKFLLGQKVKATISLEKDDDTVITGEIVGININDFYFIEKNEAIQITVQLENIKGLPDDFDPMDYPEIFDIPLDSIRKA